MIHREDSLNFNNLVMEEFGKYYENERKML